MPQNHIARVVVNLSLDKTFDYEIPPELRGQVRIGSRVDVPFGHSNRQGFVIGLKSHTQFGKLKEILRIHGDRPFIPEKLVKLGEWMADYYCCARELGIQALLPAVVRSGKVGAKKHLVVRLNPDKDIPQELTKLAAKGAKRQIEIVRRLELIHTERLADIAHSSGGARNAVKSLRECKIVLVEEETEERDPFENVKILPDVPHELTDEQTEALRMINASMEKARKDVILLYGVTGSGKTEVYMQSIAHCLEQGLEAIVLVPEISLTPQTNERFRARFGEEVSVLHSHLSDGERYDEWNKINEGKVKIVVGARSALFAPFRKLGLIIVDEEHETSYKQSGWPPNYHARDVAVMRAHFESATVVLGTATPALESYYNAMNGKYRLATLKKRVDDQRMPAMEIIDMCAEKDDAGQAQIISGSLRREITNVLEKGEQVMLFLNRRGYATQMQCLKCGYVAECDDCSINYTYHRKKELLLCHTCGSVLRAYERCPECKDPDIRYSGLGTEKVESCVRGAFPYARILRMDSDTMTRKEAYREALSAFRAHDVDILIGTQMIAKGLHFPNVTLVGVIFADMSLMIPDFRSGERTFQLLVQVAGRAGRGDVAGKVLIQTYTPFHPALEAATQLDYERFYEEEIEIREMLGFPPATHLMIIRFRGESEDLVIETIHQFADFIRPAIPDDVEMINPLPCSMAKRRGEFYYQILFNTKRIASLSRFIKRSFRSFKIPKGLKVNVNVDPMSTL